MEILSAIFPLFSKWPEPWRPTCPRILSNPLFYHDCMSSEFDELKFCRFVVVFETYARLEF